MSPTVFSTPVGVGLPRCKALEIIAERFDLTGKTVVGCGEGGFVRAPAKSGVREAIGVECGVETPAAARAATPVGSELYVQGAAEALPAPDGAADLIVFMNSLHHVPDRRHAGGFALRRPRVCVRRGRRAGQRTGGRRRLFSADPSGRR